MDVPGGVFGWLMQENPVYRLRKELKMTQTEFADVVGVSQSHISLIETGTRRAGAETALLIADAFHRQMDRLGITVEAILRGQIAT